MQIRGRFLPDRAILTLSHCIPAELENIEKWARINNLKLNKAKSHEMMFASLIRTLPLTPLPPME